MNIREIVCKFLKDNNKYEKFVLNNNSYGVKYAQNKNVFEKNITFYGLSDAFFGIFTIKDNIIRKWKYFYKNNLKIQKPSINVGDVIVLKNTGYFSDCNAYNVLDVDWEHLNVTLKTHNTMFGETMIVPMCNVKSINNNEILKHPIFYNNYYVVKNRKTYGKID